MLQRMKYFLVNLIQLVFEGLIFPMYWKLFLNQVV